jgi:hypothetical protein
MAYLKDVLQLAIGGAFAIWIFGNIAKKAGYSRLLAFAMLVPLLNIGVLIWFANSEWPIERSLMRLRLGEPDLTNDSDEGWWPSRSK